MADSARSVKSQATADCTGNHDEILLLDNKYIVTPDLLSWHSNTERIVIRKHTAGRQYFEKALKLQYAPIKDPYNHLQIKSSI